MTLQVVVECIARCFPFLFQIGSDLGMAICRCGSIFRDVAQIDSELRRIGVGLLKPLTLWALHGSPDDFGTSRHARGRDVFSEIVVWAIW